MSACKPWLSAALCVLLGGCLGTAEPLPLIIGHVSNLSGPDPAGVPAAQGIRLALQQLSADGVRETLGERRLLVRHTDSQGQLDLAESQAARLLTVHRAVALIGGSTPAEAVCLDRARVPILSWLGFPASGLSGMTFFLGMAPRRQGEVLARYVVQELTCERVLLLEDERRETSALLSEAFLQEYAAVRKGDRATVVQRFGKEASWDKLAQRAEQEKAQVLVFAGRARDLRDLRAALKRPWPVLVFAGDDGDWQGLEAGPGGDSVYLATVFAPDAKAERAHEFVQQYREAFKAEPDVAAALGYDALRLLADALKRSSTELGKPEALRDALAATRDFPAVTGPLSVTSTRQVRRPLYVARLAGAVPTALKAYAPDAAP
jgi:branched-chain amino acid transport system substrate-binding protein